MSKPLKIIDAHIHFYDHQANTYTFLDEFHPNFAELVGDYSTLPKVYMPEDYLQESKDYQVEGVVWHEFISTDPIQEVKWAQTILEKTKINAAMVALVDFLGPNLEKHLEIYNGIPKITAVREHMVWDDKNPKKCFANRPDLLRDPKWQQRLSLLEQYDFKCGLEIFSPQLPDLINVIQQHPQLEFTIALMGWPLDLSESGRQTWERDIKRLSTCDNICVSISAIECIFGMDWTLEQIKPWILTTIEVFGTNRIMFSSHMPIAKLSREFTKLYQAYENIVDDFSDAEKEDLFYGIAKKWFRL